jgi:hypothetical protein
MAEDADEALPGLQFFFAEGTGEVADDEQGVWEAAFAKLAAVNAPTAGAARGRRERKFCWLPSELHDRLATHSGNLVRLPNSGRHQRQRRPTYSDRRRDLMSEQEKHESQEPASAEHEHVPEQPSGISDTAKASPAVFDVAKAAAVVSDMAKAAAAVSDVAKASAALSDVAKASAAVSDVAKAAAVVSDMAKAAAVVSDVAKASAAISDVAKASAAVSDMAKAAAVVSDVAKASAAISDVAKASAAMSDVAKVAGIVSDMAKAAAVVSDVAKASAAISDVAKASAAVSDVAKAAAVAGRPSTGQDWEVVEHLVKSAKNPAVLDAIIQELGRVQDTYRTIAERASAIAEEARKRRSEES